MLCQMLYFCSLCSDVAVVQETAERSKEKVDKRLESKRPATKREEKLMRQNWTGKHKTRQEPAHQELPTEEYLTLSCEA